MIRILVGQRGWVHVGRFRQEGETIVLESARVIRSWGTNRGLAELCAGPTAETVLDAPATLRMHELAMVHSYDCDEDGWTEALDGTQDD